MSELAKRAQIQIGSITVDGFMLADGTYRMSQTQAAECVGDDPVYARNFLVSRALKALRGEGYTPETFEVDSSEQGRGQTRIQGWPLEIVYAYWVYRCFKGNSTAFNLVISLGTETLERRFDSAFGVSRSEAEYNQRLAQRLQDTEAQLKEQTKQFKLLEFEYTKDDITRDRYEQLKRFVRDLGFDEWGMPLPEDEQ